MKVEVKAAAYTAGWCSQAPLRVDGQSAVYAWTLTGTNTGPGGTGHAIRISGYEEGTLGTDGLIRQSLGHVDDVEYARQIREGGTRVP